MSVFQCDKCGCVENSACTPAYLRSLLLEDSEAAKSYKEVLGLGDSEKLGRYCSACSPIWFTDEGKYGVGPRPENYICPRIERGRTYHRTDGKWHAVFERMFLPKGMFSTNRGGGLRHKDSGESWSDWVERTGWDTSKEDL